jgi:hypothetical protein
VADKPCEHGCNFTVYSYNLFASQEFTRGAFGSLFMGQPDPRGAGERRLIDYTPPPEPGSPDALPPPPS